MHSNPSTCVAFDADGRLYSSGYDGYIVAWNDTLTGARWRTRHEGLANCLCLCGDVIASVGADRILRMWEIETGKPVRSKNSIQTDDLNSARFLVGHNAIVASTDDGRVLMFSLHNSELQWSATSGPPDVYGESIESISLVGADGDPKILFADGSGRVGILDVNGRLEQSGNFGAVVDCCIANQDKGIAYLGLDTGEILSLELDGLKPIRKAEAHAATVKSMALNSDGLVASASYDGRLKLWTPDLEPLRDICLSTVDRHAWARGIAFHPETKHMLACTSLGSNPVLIDTRSESAIVATHSSTHGINSIDVRHARVVLGCDDGRVWFGNATTVSPRVDLESMVLVVKVHPFEFFGAAGTQDGHLVLFDLSIGQIVFLHDNGGVPVISLCYSADGRSLNFGDYNGGLWRLNLASRHVERVTTVAAAIKSLCQIEESSYFAVAVADGSVSVIDSNAGGCIQSTNSEVFLPNALSWSSAMNCLISVSRDLAVRRWTKELALIHTDVGHTRSVKSLALSPDQRTWATGSYDSTIKIWDENGEIATCIGHDWPGVPALCWVDDNMLASGGWDGTLRFWSRQGVPITTVKLASHS